MHFIVFEGQKSITLCLLYRFAWLKICSIEMISMFHIFNTNILKSLNVSNADRDYFDDDVLYLSIADGECQNYGQQYEYQ